MAVDLSTSQVVVAQMNKLLNGTPFPHFDVDTILHGHLTIPEYFSGHYGVILFYRGAWCPYCNAQLAAYVRAQAQLDKASIRVVALSVDDATTTRATAEKRNITFPLGHSANARMLSELVGAYMNADPEYLQSAGFVIDQAGRLLTAVYSSGAIGRLMPDDVVGFVQHMKES